ncbi:MAG: hypothetical protein ACFFAU_17060, partial [Candidatus Hodarchaeota archaeon]
GKDLMMEVNIDYSGSTFMNLNFTFYLEYQGNNSITILHLNSSLYFDQNDSNYYYCTNLLFKSCDKGYWDLWAIAKDKSTGYEYIEKATFEIVPFELFLHTNVYYTYVGEPTWVAVEIKYYESIEKYISVEVLIENSSVNNSIYYADNIYFPGNPPPDTFWLDLYPIFEEMDHFTVWLVVQDQDTSKQWTVGCKFRSLWFEIEIIQEEQLFVGNLTTIEVNISSSINYPVYVNLSVYVEKWWPTTPYYMESIFQENNLLLDGSLSKDSYYNNACLSFDKHGNYRVVVIVNTTSKEIYQYYQSGIYVFETIDLRIFHEYETWSGNTENFFFEIRYFETYDSLASIELLLDNGTDNTTLFSQDNYLFNAQGGNISQCQTFPYSVPYSFTIKGYYEIHFFCTIHATGDVLYQSSWIVVKDTDVDPPIIIEISGLEDGGTYSGEIIVTANIADQSQVDLQLRVENENDSKTLDFYTEVTYNISHYLYYGQLLLDTSVLYDGDYNAIFEAKDNLGNKAITTFNVRFENGNIYVHSEEPTTSEPSDNQTLKITPGFEYMTLFLVILTTFLILKRRK